MMNINQEQQKRLLNVASKTALVLGVGIAYAVFTRLTGVGVPCIFHLLTDLYCPGCGITRMFLELFRLDFVAAARYNLLVLCLLPFALILFVHKSRQYIQCGRTKMGTIEKWFYVVVLVLCITFCVLRNTEAVAFLTMP